MSDGRNTNLKLEPQQMTAAELLRYINGLAIYVQGIGTDLRNRKLLRIADRQMRAVEELRTHLSRLIAVEKRAAAADETPRFVKQGRCIGVDTAGSFLDYARPKADRHIGRASENHARRPQTHNCGRPPSRTRPQKIVSRRVRGVS